MLPPYVEFKKIKNLIHAVRFGKWEEDDLDNIFIDLMEKNIADSQLKRVEKHGQKYKALLITGETIEAQIPCAIAA